MENITEITFTECSNSNYIKPTRMHFKQNGVSRTWDLMKVHDSVAIIIYNKTKGTLTFVKQFRPAVYISHIPISEINDNIDLEKYPSKLGLTIELCAGIVDKKKSLEEIAQEEIYEECGYKVPLEAIKKVTSYRAGVGVTGSTQHLYLAEVTNEMRVTEGGGNRDEGEFIEVVEMSFSEVNHLIYDESIPKPATFLFAVMWFFKSQNIKHSISHV